MKPLQLSVLALVASAATASPGATQLQVGQTATPTGVVGVPYSFTGLVAVSGGTTPYAFSVTTGTVPPGLTFANNAISGTPTASATPFNFTITVKDSSKPQQSGSAAVTLNIFPAGSVRITTNSLPAATIGVAYSQTLQASGGVKPYTWALRGSSTLPAGLKLSGSSISGTPAAQAMSASFTIQVTDSSNNPPQNTAQMPLTITVQAPPLKITSTTLPSGTVGSAYSTNLNATGGTAPLAWSIASGSSAPGGLTLSPTGQLSGTPSTASGTTATSFRVQVQDSAHPPQTASATLGIQIAPDPLSITTTSLASGTVGTAYSARLASSGGTGTVTWKLASGSSLVAGLSLSLAGSISGTPTAGTNGAGSFTVTATDSATPAHTATTAVTYTINLPQAATPTFSPTGGTYTSAQSVTILDTAKNATIYYTTDGTTPTTSSPIFSKPGSAGAAPVIKVSSTMTIKAIATAPNYSTSAVGAAVYTIELPGTACTGDGSRNGLMKGAYAFELLQTYPGLGGGIGYIIGQFTSDGLGNISGTFDTNSPFNSKNGVTAGSFTGSYSIGLDDRGALTVKVTQGGSSKVTTYSYCLALDSISNNVAGAGRMVETDTANGVVASGAFYAQGGSNFTTGSVKGSWVFGMEGGQVPSESSILYRDAVAGFLTFDGAGKITAGGTDVSSDQPVGNSGSVSNEFFQQTGMTGTYTMASNGRGVITVQIPSGETGAGTTHTIFYIAGNTHALLMSADPSGSDEGPTMEGNAYLRTTTTFNNAALKGTSVYISKGVSNHNSSQYDQLAIEAGIVSWDGAGNLTASGDMNNGGVITPPAGNTSTAPYSVDANGRVTTSGGPIFYILGKNQGFGIHGGAKAPLVYFTNQSIPTGGFSLSSFSGGYSLGTVWYDAEVQAIFTGELTAGGNGSLSQTIDMNDDGTVQTDSYSTASYTASSNGRFLLSSGSTAAAYACYFVSPTQAYMIAITNGQTDEPIYVFNHQ